MLSVYLGIFGLLGVFSRYYIGKVFQKYTDYTFPIDILTINILGAFLIGVIYSLSFEKYQFSSELKTGIIIGFLGGFTTFSSYCLDTYKLIAAGKFLQAFLYFTVSPVLGLVITFLGIYVTKKFF
ncbi:fluoride efflux transporter CrcB [Pigmentibacter ruber]|uniref:fluoride efflux transporter CrcB n=1 Tax=Pigmentibacter ruber TaxID=2683196 RepID=UPI00131C44EC|nr:fluoride efflux transporter CrcB [Pigmentibacter ruber]BFD33426.1 fluoride efflux transporter CrcB [Pigmentibacter ruber]